MSLTLNMVGGGGGKLKNTDAILSVTAPTGSAITATKGAVTLTPTIWTKADDNTLDVGIFIIHASQFDSVNPWTVTATLGRDTATDTIIINAADEYDVELSYELYLVRDGIFTLDYTRAKAGPSNTTFTENASGYVEIYIPISSSSYTLGYFQAVDLTGFNYLVFDGEARGYYAPANYTPAFGVVDQVRGSANASTFSASVQLTADGGNTWSGRDTNYVDISSLNGTKNVGFQCAGSNYSQWYGGIHCWNFYLTNAAPT